MVICLIFQSKEESLFQSTVICYFQIFSIRFHIKMDFVLIIFCYITNHPLLSSLEQRLFNLCNTFMGWMG